MQVDSAVDLDAMQAWMDGQRLGSGAIEDVRRLTGGTQNILLRFTRGDRDYVFRRPPPHPRPNSNDIMRREMRLLGAIEGTAVPHPHLIAACGDEAVLGVAFYLMEPIEGFNPTSGLPLLHAGSAGIQQRMGIALAEAIAALGALDYRALGLDDFGRPDSFLERQVPRWSKLFESYAEFSAWTGPGALPDVDAIGRWLDDHRPSHFAPGIMHGDYHLANVMFRNDGPELAAIVDWEMATIGDPLVDLGWLLATWPEPGQNNITTVTPWIGFPGPAELIETYRAHSQRDLAAIDWYLVFACYKLGIVLEGTHARACAGKAPCETGDLLHARSISLLERAHRLIR